MIKVQTQQLIRVSDFDDLVIRTYGKPYSFHQQDGCKPRGTFHLTVPDGAEDYENDTVPEVVNGRQMGVSFAAWLARNPKQKIPQQTQDYQLELFWERNFYPNVQMVANDLHAKGLFPAGDYVIEIDW